MMQDEVGSADEPGASGGPSGAEGPGARAATGHEGATRATGGRRRRRRGKGILAALPTPADRKARQGSHRPAFERLVCHRYPQNRSPPRIMYTAWRIDHGTARLGRWVLVACRHGQERGDSKAWDDAGVAHWVCFDDRG